MPLRIAALLVFIVFLTNTNRLQAEGEKENLVEQIRELESRVIVLGKVRQPPLVSMLPRDVSARLRMANRADTRAWEEVKTRADWERFRETRLQALRASLGTFPPTPEKVKSRIVGSHQGDGYKVDNLVFQSRPGCLVTANLYRPSRPVASMPGIIICTSHLQPKHIGVRQDMGMTWARAGCLVLVPDHLGHGERRQHPFVEPSPHDYHFRYDNAIQLHLAGESLMGWLAWDLMRGVDVLLTQKEIDPKRVLIISEPAGGGDVAAVTAALDPRISGVMVNNFGGPQPETAYPLAKDAEHSYEFAGSGSWESTRSLRLSARDGFLPWEIVASIAPRRLIYYHEFYWDKENDPVWKRLQKVYGFYNAADSLSGMAGKGFVVGSDPENTHWIPLSRELLYPVLNRWFDIANPGKEYSKRRPPEELLCLTPEVSKEFKAEALHVVLARLGNERSETAVRERSSLKSEESRVRLRQQWTKLLGNVSPEGDAIVKGFPLEEEHIGTTTIRRLHLGTEEGIVVPVVLLLPPCKKDERMPVVVAVAQEGKQAFLRRRAETIAELLKNGIAVCLPDVRGTGETAPGEERDRRSAITNLSASEWMMGSSLLGCRLRDLRSVLRHLRQIKEIDGNRMALWGDSFAPVNALDRDLKVPYTATNRPTQSEPLGGLLALLGALFEGDIHSVYLRGGLSDYHSVLQSPFCYLPHDVVVPGVLTTGDLCDVAAALTPRPLRMEGLVDGHNREVSTEELQRRYASARRTYADVNAKEAIQIVGKPAEKDSPAQWLIGSLKVK